MRKETSDFAFSTLVRVACSEAWVPRMYLDVFYIGTELNYTCVRLRPLEQFPGPFPIAVPRPTRPVVGSPSVLPIYP